MKRKYTEKWGNMGGLKKAPFFFADFVRARSCPCEQGLWNEEILE